MCLLTNVESALLYALSDCAVAAFVVLVCDVVSVAGKSASYRGNRHHATGFIAMELLCMVAFGGANPSDTAPDRNM